MRRGEKDADTYSKESEQRLNRQINYFVMRYMWQVIRGRDAYDTIYSAFNATSRERYTRVINTGTVRYKKDELNTLNKDTGIDKSIFTGERRFYIVGMEEQKWKELFEFRSEARKGNKIAKKDYKLREEEAKEKIRKSQNPDEKTNFDLFRLCSYLRNEKPMPDISAEIEIRNMTEMLNNLSMETIERNQDGALMALKKSMSEKMKWIDALLIYRKASQTDKK